ncbi:MAG: hypothetical protein Q8R78_02375, partial [Candidatus Omnitrophota bacterium]|nr:hypothetical protein [Candidatus Omnitrophota bacterium]
MSTTIVASLQPGDGRTTITAGLGACLADAGPAVRLLRVRAPEGADAPAEDDARALAAVPGCDSPGGAVTPQDAQAQARDADSVTLIEAPPGDASELAGSLAARILLVSSSADDLRLGDLASARARLGDAFAGVIFCRQPERRLEQVRSLAEERGLACLGVLPEDRLLAGPTVAEMAGALHASRLVEGGEEGEAVQFVMLGPISADPGQPYFLQHEGKAVVNRFDKMDLHLAALA